MKVYWMIAISLLAVAVVSGQASIDTVEKPPQRQYDDGYCYEKEVKMLMLSTDVRQEADMQLKYQRAAESYAKLEVLGQKCDYE